MSAENTDLSWIQRLPKISLHDHLDGGLQPQTMIDIARETGYRLPAQTADRLRVWFEENANSHSLPSYLETFEHTVALMQRAEDLRRVAKEHVLTLAADGVIYGEVRWAPEQHTAAGLSMEQALAAVAEGLDEGMEIISRGGGRVLVNQIVCAMRHRDSSFEVARLAVRHRRMGVVGFDLAGPEDGYPASDHRRALDYAAEHFFPVTLHAGEAAGLDSIRSALLDGRAQRLGHGVRITEDFTYTSAGDVDPDGTLMPGVDPAQPIVQLGEVASWVKDRRITLEVCPSSNLQTGAAAAVVRGESTDRRAESYAEHPVNMLRQAGFSVAIGPDNRLMSTTSITAEFSELARNFGYGPAEFFELTTNAIEGAFVSMEEKQLLLRSVQEPYLRLMREGSTGNGHTDTENTEPEGR